jgi:hypothetical protein
MPPERLPRRWRINPASKPSREIRARRRLAVGLLVSAVLIAGRLATSSEEPPKRILPTMVGPPVSAGSQLFPKHRVVAYYGAPQDTKLGALGIGTPDQAAAKLRRQARSYANRARPVIPAMELLAVIASSLPGDDGLHRTRQAPLTIQRYHEAARRAHAMLILDIQPGQSDFLTEAKLLEPYLKQPDVGLALDPEWHLQPGEIPGQTLGSATASEVNDVAEYLNGLVEANRLPQKLLLVHSFTEEMIRPKFALRAPPGVAEVINVDGVGRIGVKRLKYVQLTGRQSPTLKRGFKLFYTEDEKGGSRLMRPREVLGLTPPPDVVVYE